MTHDDYTHFAVPFVSPVAEPMTWHPAIDAHCVLVGGTRDERDELVGAVAAVFATADWSVQWGTSIEEQREVITDMWVLMQQRFDQHMTDPTARDQWDPIVLVVDNERVPLVRGFSQGATTVTVQDQIKDLLMLSRAAKIHLLVGTSSPIARLLCDDVRDNIPVRVRLDGATRDHQLLQA